MKRFIKYILVALVTVIMLTGCEEWLDVNTDPNGIVDSPAITEDIYLIGIEAEWVQQLVSQSVNYQTWTCYYAAQQTTSPSFIIGPGQWNCYAGSLKHAIALYDKAKENGNNHYQGIAAIIAAWHWFNLADLFDKAPLEQAMKGDEYPYPEVASQEALYAHANSLLDEAIVLLSGPSGELKPAKDDYILKGDMTKWVKAAYSIRARQAMRLSYGTGTTPVAQADITLAALQNAMTDNSNDLTWVHGSDQGNWSSIYGRMLYDYSAEGMTPNLILVDLMNSCNDPRRAIMFTEAEMGGYKGMQDRAMFVEGDKPSRFSYDWIVPTFPDYMITYHECKFLEAEAYALKSDWANCKIALDKAIRADMEQQGVDENDILTYLAQPELDVPDNIEDAQKLVIEQKYIANVFETTEQYFDWIRTGYPVIDFVYAIKDTDNSETMPRRAMYPADEIDKNPNIRAIGQPDYFAKGTSWDNKPRK